MAPFVSPVTRSGAAEVNATKRPSALAPRGETQWVRNICVSREARLTLGRRTETVHVVEVPDREKAPILRAYPNGRWSAVIRRPLLGVFRRQSRRSPRWR